MCSLIVSDSTARSYRTAIPGYILSASEQDGHDERMRKPDLHAIHEPVPSAFENGEVVVVSWIGDDFLQQGRHGGREEGKSRVVNA